MKDSAKALSLAGNQQSLAWTSAGDPSLVSFANSICPHCAGYVAYEDEDGFPCCLQCNQRPVPEDTGKRTRPATAEKRNKGDE